MQAKEVVGKARPRFGMLGMYQGLRVPQGLPHPAAGLEDDPLPFFLPLPWGAPRAPLAAPHLLPAFRSGRERRLGGAWAGGWRCG